MTSKETLQPNEPFEFTERERLYDRISHARFQSLLQDARTTIHTAELSSNSYGEFLFVTISQGGGERRRYLTFYGLGYHDYRERWITDVWSWFRANDTLRLQAARLTREAVEQMIAERLADIRPELGKDTQSPRGLLYEFLAEIVDEDGAISELEDMEDVADWPFGDEHDDG